MVEKWRHYEQQYLRNIVTADITWNTLAYGSIACKATGNFDPTWIANPGWYDVLPWRECVYFKNQGVNNDGTTDCQIELWFNQYTVNKFKSVGYGTTVLAAANTYGLGYNATTGLFTLNTGGTITPTTGNTPNDMYLELEPFGTMHGNISQHDQTLSAVCKNVTLVGGNVYTFDVNDGTTLTFAAAGYINCVLGDIGKTVTNGAGTTGRLMSYDNAARMWVINPTSATVFTTEAVTIAAGTGAGTITVVRNPQIKQMLINNLTLANENNRSFHPPTFYQYIAAAPTTERGIILNTGESYSADMTHDICIWYRCIASADIGATLVIQQLR
jgi:hypothetical protein